MRSRIDPASRSFVVICECGWRTITFSHERALEVLVTHELLRHREHRHARKALAAHRRRRRRDTPATPPA